MTDQPGGLHAPATALHDQVGDRLGVVPNFFRLAPEARDVTTHLWGFAKAGHFDNPLPALFKERLFVYLSRFCDVRYCLARHVAFLLGRGRLSGDAASPPQSLEQVMRLLRLPFPRDEALEPCLALLDGGGAPLTVTPEAESDTEAAMFACAGHVLLQTEQAAPCLTALRRSVAAATLEHLLLFLTYVRTAHFWTTLHPELTLDDDVAELLTVHESLAEHVRRDAEAAGSSVVPSVLQELDMLRSERSVWQAARDSEARFRSLVAASAQIVWAATPDGQIIEDSPSWRAVTGQTYDQWTGWGWIDALHPDDQPLARQRWSEAVGRQTAYECEYRLRGADGSYRWTLARGVPVRGEDGSVREWVGTNTDITERKQAEQARAEEARQFEVLFDQAVDGIFLADVEGRYLDVNPAGCQMLGCARTDIVGRTIADLVAADEVPRIAPEVAKFEGGAIATSVWRLRRKDGSFIVGEVVGRQLPDGRLLAIVRDITERQRTLQLEASQRRTLELIARNAPVETVCEAVVRMVEDQTDSGMVASILLLDADGVHLRHGAAPNLPEAYIRGIDGVAIGPSVGSCGTAAYRQQPVYVADIASDPLWTDFADLALSHGLRACWSTPILSSGGRLLGTLAMYYPEVRQPNTDDLRLVDTATRTAAIAIERQQAEDALRESDERFRTLADNIPQLAWIADAGTDGQVHWFNRNWFEYTGTTLEQVRGSGWHVVHHPDHAERVIRKFVHHVQQGLDWEDTFPLRRHDGEYRWFLSRMKCIRDESGTVVRIFGTNTDVTQQRELEDELRRLTDDLSEADRRKDEFLATLAHELRNPLAPIRTGLQLMRMAGGSPETRERAGAMMERQLTQLVRLVDDLMDVSRVSRGKIELRRERVLLATVVESAVETSRPQIEAMGHDLTVTLPTHPVLLDADLTRLAQVVMNLLNNAAKYSNRGGQIWLTAEQQHDEIAIAVRDTGIGIPADQLPRVFELFTQVDHDVDRAHGGLGIGLSLVKRLVEMHGGSVEARSDGPGTGAEFIVRLPVAANAPVPEPGDHAAALPGPVPTPSRRILVVDDNRDGADSLALLLEGLGHDICTAYDGKEALDVAERFRPDVVLLDLGLPKLDGYETCRRLQAQPWGRTAIRIALTGWGQDDDRRRSREAGFHHHMVKPVDLATLVRLLT